MAALAHGRFPRMEPQKTMKKPFSVPTPGVCLPLLALLGLLPLACHRPHAGFDPDTATERTAHESEVKRLQRVENLAPLALPGEDPIQAHLVHWLEALRIPGLSVAVVDQGRLAWAKTYGLKEAGSPGKVTLDTRFQAGALSQPVTALAALSLVEAETLTLDGNVNASLTGWQVPDNDLTRDQKVTLRRLLSHSAGTTVHGLPGYAPGAPLPTLVQLLKGEHPANAPAVAVDQVPGTGARASDGGFAIVQQLMTDTTGKTFPLLMAETVIRPLGLFNCSFFQPPTAEGAARAASGHTADGKVLPGRWQVHPAMAAAGLWTNAMDLADLAMEVARAKGDGSKGVISRTLATEMLKGQAGPFGLGWRLEAGTDGFGLTGRTTGFSAYFQGFAGQGQGVVILANSGHTGPLFDHLAASVAREYAWTGFRTTDLPVAHKLLFLAARKGLPRALDRYRALKAEPGDLRLTAQDLTVLGHHYLAGNKVPDALACLNANVLLYPEAASAFEALGDGQVKAGDPAAARGSYRRALELEPGNRQVERKLAALSPV